MGLIIIYALFVNSSQPWKRLPVSVNLFLKGDFNSRYFGVTLQEIQAHYDEVHRQLQVTVDQYGVAQRKLQATTSELEEIRSNYEQALRSRRAVEQQYEDATTRISELTTINVNLASTKSKIEQELSTIASDYDEVTKELRVSTKDTSSPPKNSHAYLKVKLIAQADFYF